MDPIIVALLVLPFAGAILCGMLPRGAKTVASVVAAATAALAVYAVAHTYPGRWEAHFGALP